MLPCLSLSLQINAVIFGVDFYVLHAWRVELRISSRSNVHPDFITRNCLVCFMIIFDVIHATSVVVMIVFFSSHISISGLLTKDYNSNHKFIFTSSNDSGPVRTISLFIMNISLPTAMLEFEYKCNFQSVHSLKKPKAQSSFDLYYIQLALGIVR